MLIIAYNINLMVYVYMNHLYN